MLFGMNALLEGYAISSAKSQVSCALQLRKCKGRTKRDRLLVSLVEFNLWIYQHNKNVHYDPSFLN